MGERIEVDHEATLAAVRREAEMWRTAKDRMAERCIAAEAEAARIQTLYNATVERAQRAYNERDAAEARCAALEAALRDVLEEYIDACHYATGNEPLSSPTWHNFVSNFEDATDLIPRARALLESPTGEQNA
jgi:hypothetical protein